MTHNRLQVARTSVILNHHTIRIECRLTTENEIHECTRADSQKDEVGYLIIKDRESWSLTNPRMQPGRFVVGVR